MLSVIPSNENTSPTNGGVSTTTSTSPPRNLSLNLSQQYVTTTTTPSTTNTTTTNSNSTTTIVNASHNPTTIQYQQQPPSKAYITVAQDVDVMLANVESCDERTRLLDDGTPSPAPRRQSSTNANSNNNNNNINNKTVTATTTTTETATNINYSIVNKDDGGGGGGSGGNGLAVTAANAVATTDADADADDAFSEEAAETTATLESDVTDNQQTHPRQNLSAKKPKQFTKLGTKNVGLKRVSFGSSKGSMVETLVFETPTPLSEHVEPQFGFDMDNHNQPMMTSVRPATNYNFYTRTPNMDDSGIEVQEESERSIVRVSIYQSSQPQQICPPADFLSQYEDNQFDAAAVYSSYDIDDINQLMATTANSNAIPGYDRQQSTDSGWDNPFRPGGDLSREADEIVSMIRGGKPITPTEDHSIGNGNAQKELHHSNGTAATTNNAENITQTQSAQNGTKIQNKEPTTATGAPTTTGIGGVGGSGKMASENNGVTSLGQVSKQVVPGPTSASHVVIDEKKNKKKGCCVVQ